MNQFLSLHLSLIINLSETSVRESNNEVFILSTVNTIILYEALPQNILFRNVTGHGFKTNSNL